LLGLFLHPEDGSDMFPERRLSFNGLHGVIVQKIELFTSTTVRTSDLICLLSDAIFADFRK
jgi:hypothetical protein